MIKNGQTAVMAPGISHIYCGSSRVYGVPSAYRRLTGISFSSGTYYEITGLKLKGSDTVRLSISVNKACNVFGCYTTTSADDNYSLYVSTASGAKYLRYDGSTYKSYWRNQDLGERFDIVISPTGSSGMPSGQDDSWAKQSFTASANMCIGTTATGATSAKFDGRIFGNFVVDGRFCGVPVERTGDGTIGYYDLFNDTFHEPIGSNPSAVDYA